MWFSRATCLEMRTASTLPTSAPPASIRLYYFPTTSSKRARRWEMLSSIVWWWPAEEGRLHDCFRNRSEWSRRLPVPAVLFMGRSQMGIISAPDPLPPAPPLLPDYTCESEIDLLGQLMAGPLIFDPTECGERPRPGTRRQQIKMPN